MLRAALNRHQHAKLQVNESRDHLIITHPYIGRVITGVCYTMGLSVCPRSKRKRARAINAELGRHTARGSRSAKRSKVKVTRLSNALPYRLCSVHVDKTALVFTSLM